MKFEMKKFFLLLLLILFYTNTAIAQGPPAPPCDCCTDLEPTDPTQEPSQAYTDCVNECLAGEDPCMPINSSLIFLFVAGISIGFYSINKSHKKRPLEN